jgi:hypothetical protein
MIPPFSPDEAHAYGITEEMLGFFGFETGSELIAANDRCWLCDRNRIHLREDHSDCHAGLCEVCCDQLRKESPIGGP